jgi:deoxyribodipyrimidine photo-lyase
MHQCTLFLFRRDLRLVDNTGLIAACEESETVLPAFIFDPRQCDPETNSFFSQHAFTFMVRSLFALGTALEERGGRLYVFEGEPLDIVGRLAQTGVITAVYVNRDYTPFSRQRDADLRQRCRANGLSFRSCNDLLLTEPEDVQPEAGTPFTVYSKFRRAAQSLSVSRPAAEPEGNFYDRAVPVPTASLSAYDRYSAEDLLVKGGRPEGLDLLDDVDQLGAYRDARHQPAEASHTGLSAHHKFGTVSIRESYWAVKNAFEDYHKLLSQLYWRDFYTHLLYHRPKQLHTSLQPKGRYLDWRNDRAEFDRWCEGETGVPFVDAGMRQLNETGYMHNRARMVVASFLTKDLLVDWRWGAQYFARTLTDYDPAVNAGNWQWAASVGTDYKLRIYNPYLQAEKHDPDAAYIKAWVPELRPADAERLISGEQMDFSNEDDYPPPLVDRNEAYHRARDAFEAAREAATRANE